MASATIYKIRDRVSGKCYIGCTTLPIDVRIYQHLSASASDCTSRQVMEHNTYEVEVLEKCAAENRYAREAHYINEFRDYVVNRVGVRAPRGERPNRLDTKKEYVKTDIQADTKAEYRRKYKTEVRKAETQSYNQDYYDRNKERLTAKMTCGCGGRYCILTKSSHLKTKQHMQWEMQTEMEAFVQEV